MAVNSKSIFTTAYKTCLTDAIFLFLNIKLLQEQFSMAI